MKIEKLGLKHLAPYPMGEENGLLIRTNKRKATKSGQRIGYYDGRLIGISTRTDVEIVFDPVDYAEDFELNEIKPILHPLSDLTKEIERDGERFVPIVELAKMSWPNNEPLIKKYEIKNGSLWYKFDYDYHLFSFSSYDGFNSCRMTPHQSFLPISNQIELFEKLFSWHFDVFGLIDSGIAIDINTLNL